MYSAGGPNPESKQKGSALTAALIALPNRSVTDMHFIPSYKDAEPCLHDLVIARVCLE